MIPGSNQIQVLELTSNFPGDPQGSTNSNQKTS